jgi:multiple sugar transport system ATP-binding protein
LRPAAGQGFDLGIRPEDIYLNEQHRRTEHTEQELGELVVEVKVVEPLGRETLIRGGLPNSGVMLNIQTGANVRLHPSDGAERPPQRGDRLSLKLDLDKLFVFDSATGDKLYS